MRISQALPSLILTAWLIAGAAASFGKVGKNPISANKVPVTDFASLIIEINGKEIEQPIVIGLFGKDMPYSSKNFREICRGAKDEEDRYLSYAGAPFHRIIPGFMIHGGDVLQHNGKNNAHIYPGKFKDEGEFNILHEIGCVGLANSGKDSSGSQFYIPTAPVNFLDGRHAIIGRVVKGMDVVESIEKLGTNSGNPTGQAIIKSCTVLETYDL
jgi:cyclophilin family peptidyl-prolyl cis-trans isomerase